VLASVTSLSAALAAAAVVGPFAPGPIARTGRVVEPIGPPPPSVVAICRTPPAVGSGRVWIAGDGRTAASRYGAPEPAGDAPLVTVRVGTLAVGIDPFTPFPGAGRRALERARVDALRRAGLVGGVRTFVSPRREPATRAIRAVSRPDDAPAARPY